YDTEGLEYHYTIEEITVPGYDSNVTSILTEDGDTHQFVLVNSLVTTQVEVTKIWSDFNNQYNLRPDSITVRLIQNGTEIDKMKLTANSDWKGTFVELPLYDSKGKTYDYTILEDEVEGYTTKIVGTTITNTLRSRLPQSGGGSTTTTKPGTKLPQTGDQSNPMLISLAGLAILSLAGTVIVTRRRKSE
ncbi:Cna B-type domain-containing protein, partial [Enterococcus lemanii]